LGTRPFAVADSIEMTKLIDPQVELARYYPAGFKVLPDGRHFVIVTRRGNLATGENDYALILFETASVLDFVNRLGDGPRAEGKPLLRLSSSSNDAPIREVRWLADSRTLVFLGEIEGAPRQVFSLDIASGETRQLTHHSRPVEAFDVEPGADRLIFVSTVADYPEGHGKTSYVVGTRNIFEILYVEEGELPSSRYQYYATLKGSAAPATAIGPPFHSQFLDTWLSPDGRWAIGVQSPNEVPRNWPADYVPFARDWYFRELGETFDEETMLAQQDIVLHFVLIDLVGGSVVPVFDAPTGAFFAGSKLDALWLPGSGSVILANTFLPLDVTDAAERERRKQAPAIVEFELDTRQLRRIVGLDVSRSGDAERRQFVGMEMTPEGWLNIEWRSSKGLLPAELYHKRAGEWEVQPARDGNTRDVTSSNRLALSIRQSPDTPPDILARDTRTGREKLITDLNPQFRELQLGTVEPFEWSDAKGRSWVGGVVYPPGFKRGDRHPLVIQTYGFHPDEFLVDGAGGFSSAFAARALVNRGLLVLQVPVSWGQLKSGPPIEDGRPEEIEAARAAIEAAIDRLDTLELIDRKRVGIIGFSRTGLYVQSLITFSDYEFAAATIADSFHISLLEYIGRFGTPNPGMLEMERLVDARPWGEELEKWVARDPVLHTDRVKTPLRLEFYGSRGLFSWWDAYVLLKRQHRPVELVHFPDGTHNLVKPAQRLASLQGNVDWFAFWLKGEEDPDPAKTEQYQRWRKLREQRAAVTKP
jgi:dipeptidyl aminopeptidase/acylaminoacyl peptidase